MSVRRITGMAGYLWRSRFAQNVLTLQVGSVLGMGLGFVRSIVIARMLGLSGWGEYSVVLVFVGTLTTVVNLGQNQAALTFFAEAYSLKDVEKMKRVIKYFVILTLFAVSTVMALMILAPLLTDWLYADRDIGRTARIALLGVVVGSFDGLFLMFLQVTRNIRKMAVFENVNQVLQFGLSIALLAAGFGVPGVLLGAVLGNIVMIGVYVVDYHGLRKKFPFPGVRESMASRRSVGDLFLQGLWIALDKNMGKLFPQGFLFVMSLFATKEVVGLAQLAFKVASLPSSFFLPHVGRMASTMLPAIQAEGPATLRKRCVSIIKHSVVVHGAGTLVGMAVLPSVAVLLYGSEYGSLRWPIVWLTAILGISALNVLNSPFLRLRRKTHLAAIWNAVSLPLEFVLLAFLMRFIDPVYAFIAIIGVNLGTGLWINAYIFLRLSSPRA